MSQQSNYSEDFLPKIKFIAAGGAACNFVSGNKEFLREFDGVLCLDSDLRSTKFVDNQFVTHCLCLERFRGFGAGGDADFVKKNADKELLNFEHFFEKTDVILLLVGLGGGTGTGLSALITQKAIEFGVFVITIPIMPFDFEGKNRFFNAESAKKVLQTTSDIVIPLKNDALFQYASENSTINEAFAQCNSWLISLINSLIGICKNKATTGCNFNSLVKHFADKPDNVFWAISTANTVENLYAALTKFPMLIDHECTNSNKNAILYIKTTPNVDMDSLKSLNYKIQNYLNEPTTTIITANEIINTPTTKLEVFLIYSHKRNENQTIRYRKEKTNNPTRKDIQPQFNFNNISCEDYWDTPTYIRKGIKLEK